MSVVTTGDPGLLTQGSAAPRSRWDREFLVNSEPETRRSPTLYFAYTAMISPTRIREVAPEAAFQFIAHLPETKMVFPLEDRSWHGALPSVVAEPGNTVWGAVFEVSDRGAKAIGQAEAEESRVASTDFKAVDREGRRHQVLTHVHNGVPGGSFVPSRDYMALVVEGGRHWGLPTGWVAGLEEYVEEPLI